MPSDKTFAAKLAAFMLNAVDHHIVCKEKGGFSDSATETVGLLPFLHMNISREDFSKLLNKSNGNMYRAMKSVCNKAGLNKKLASVEFNCDYQSSKAINVLVERIIDTIEFAYNTRVNGKRRARELATLMRLQQKKNIIPEASIAWCEGIKSTNTVQLS